MRIVVETVPEHEKSEYLYKLMMQLEETGEVRFTWKEWLVFERFLEEFEEVLREKEVKVEIHTKGRGVEEFEFEEAYAAICKIGVEF